MCVLIAVGALLFWLLYLAQNTQEAQYFYWAILLILLWAWPRSRQDPDNRRGLGGRMLLGVLIVLVIGVYAVLKDQWLLLLLPLEVIVLLLVGLMRSPSAAPK